MELKSRHILSGSHLKWTALITMVIDHTAMALVSRECYPLLYSVMRSIGRIAFPIFCFLLIEGFYHTRNFWKYAASLGIFALISEIPYNLLCSDALCYPERQNIFFTLLLGLIMIKLMQEKGDDMAWRIIFLMGAGGIAQLFDMDYGMFGIMQIAGLYFCRGNNGIRDAVLILLNLFQGGLQSFGGVAAIPIECYNGERGRQWKYFFYAVYPVHIMILFLIRKNWGLMIF